MKWEIPGTWSHMLKDEMEKPYFLQLENFVDEAYKSGTCYPPISEIFSAFRHCAFDNVKVVIIGQDPYHGPMQANGLCFSVKDEIRIPPSLKNIFKELQSDLGKPIPTTGNLENWAKQGVLLLNTTLTVREGAAASHQKKGWETFTNAVIKMVSEKKQHVVFMLWGNFAQQKTPLIDSNKHLILTSAHPSPLSAYQGFFGCKHFSLCNNYLSQHHLAPIIW
jgi:uracil-DNA glycosylase